MAINRNYSINPIHKIAAKVLISTGIAFDGEEDDMIKGVESITLTPAAIEIKMKGGQVISVSDTPRWGSA